MSTFWNDSRLRIITFLSKLPRLARIIDKISQDLSKIKLCVAQFFFFSQKKYTRDFLFLDFCARIEAFKSMKFFWDNNVMSELW